MFLVFHFDFIYILIVQSNKLHYSRSFWIKLQRSNGGNRRSSKDLFRINKFLADVKEVYLPLYFIGFTFIHNNGTVTSQSSVCFSCACGLFGANNLISQLVLARWFGRTTRWLTSSRSLWSCCIFWGVFTKHNYRSINQQLWKRGRSLAPKYRFRIINFLTDVKEADLPS